MVGAGVGEDDGRLEMLGFLKIHCGIGHDDDGVARLHLACSSTVSANDSRTAATSDDVSVKAFAIIVIDDIHTFTGNNVGGVHQVLVDSDAANIVQLRFSDGDTVNFRFDNLYLHIE